MNKANNEAISMLFPMVNSEIVRYYPNQYHITCEVRIRISSEFVNSCPVLISPMFINTVKGKSWLTIVYDVPYQENMILIMHQKFTVYLSKLQLIVEHWKILRSKTRIDRLRKLITDN